MKRSNFDIDRLESAKKLKVNENFTPCQINTGDELYPNGIFVFNITKMNEYINNNLEQILLSEVAVADFPACFSSIDETHVDTVDISRPAIIAEIAPGNYTLIDGNHRMEKARRLGMKNIWAYKLNVEQHIQFLTKKEAYLSYVRYWNGKIN